jgi:transcriptional regulator with XRE-family HTH domain
VDRRHEGAESSGRQGLNVDQLSKRTAEADKRVGACVRAARVKAGLSQSKLANELGITFQQLQKYEKGKNRIAVSTLLLIADALAVPVHSFFDAIERQSDDASAWPDLLTKENIRLIKAFSGIGDAEVRRRIMNLVMAVTDVPVESSNGADSLALLASSGIA